MTERPILFSGPMVRAILSGQKTVTRREVKKRNALDCLAAGFEPEFLTAAGNADMCPYGQVGDRLWVRESFADLYGTGIEHRPDPAGPPQRYAYTADSPAGSYADDARKTYGIKWKPSIHMPRRACRILLEVTAVRVERLQDISDERCLAEGLPLNQSAIGVPCTIPQGETIPRVLFKDLWVSTGGDWDANPWVWVVEFNQVAP